MLIAEHGDIGCAFEGLRNGEGARRSDIVQTNCAECRSKGDTGFDNLVDRRGIEHHRECIDTRKGLEDNGFAFGQRKLGQRMTTTCGAEEIGAIGHERHGITAAGEIVAAHRIELDGGTGGGNAGSVDK